MKTAIIFVYNADSGAFNTLTDIAHKIFSPATYACNLCAITHSTFGMRKEWRAFLSSLDASLKFLHADELKHLYNVEGIQLPAIFTKQDENIDVLIGADEINRCKTIDELKQLILRKLD